jgi:hypothetical protein
MSPLRLSQLHRRNCCARPDRWLPFGGRGLYLLMILMAIASGCSRQPDAGGPEAAASMDKAASSNSTENAVNGDSTDPSASSENAGDASAKRVPGRNLAIRAKDQLAQRLMGRLVEAMAEGGPASAIEVCSREAPSIAAQVGQENGVRIGRTSFRIRNPENSPPQWAEEWVEQRVDSPRFQVLDSGATAAMFPIKIQPTCLACHGQEIQPEIQEQLARLYPNDQATGFALNDLRGWFWVEVPADLPSLEH